MHSAVQSSIVGRAPLILLLLLLTCASPALSQAPGDSDPYCTNLHPGYEERVNPLMDTYNYSLLLPTTTKRGVWQSLNLDENNEDGQLTAWSSGGLSCFIKLYVCGFDAGRQENWLITQHISRQVERDATTVTLQSVAVTFDVTFSPDCAASPSCIKALSLYVWETSAPDNTSARDTSNYHFIANVTADSPEVTLNFSSQNSGFYLGIRDNGTCVSGMNYGGLNRVLVSYKSEPCPSGVVGLVSVAEAVPGMESVPGQCVANSSAVEEGGPLLSCSYSGDWSVLSGCECDPGHWLSEETQECVECPSNSEGTQAGLSECLCVEGYYRVPDEGAGEACTQPPSAPRNVTVSTLTNTSIILSWLPPEQNGGRNTSEITYTVSYQASSSRQQGMAETTASNTIELKNLTPYVRYTLSVTAKNRVSYLSSDSSGSTASITATTLEGVAAKVTVLQQVSQDKLVWSPPDPPHGAILYYNIRITHQQKERTIMRHNQTSITTMVWIRDWNVTDGLFEVQVQAVTRIGAGEFSDPVNVFVSDESPTSVSAVLLISILVPSVFVLILIIALLILMAYVSGRLSKLRQNQRPHTKKREIKHAIEEYASVRMSEQQFMDGGEGVVRAPAVPTSPCPTLNRDKTSDNRSREGLSQVPGSDSPYAVLEGPGHHTAIVSENERLYTPDPTTNFLEAVNPVFALSEESERTTERVGPTSTCQNQNQPLYWELEAPNDPALVQHRERRGERAPPALTSVTGNAYWNEGLGPPDSESFTTPQNTSTSTAIRSETGEPFYLQLTAQNTE